MTRPEPDDELLLRRQAAEDDRAAAIARTWLEANVPARYRDPLPLTPALSGWLDQVLLERTREGLLLLGPTGTGKTHTAWSLLAHLTAAGAPCTGWSVPDLLDACRPGRDADALEVARRMPFLLLDDVAVGKATDWTAELLYRLVNYRHDHDLTTLVTTNVPPAQLEAELGQRLASRLVGMTRQLVLAGPDRRRQA